MVVSEIGDFVRFTHPKQLMSYLGLAPGEYSSGGKQKKSGITKCGNSHFVIPPPSSNMNASPSTPGGFSTSVRRISRRKNHPGRRLPVLRRADERVVTAASRLEAQAAHRHLCNALVHDAHTHHTTGKPPHFPSTDEARGNYVRRLEITGKSCGFTLLNLIPPSAIRPPHRIRRHFPRVGMRDI